MNKVSHHPHYVFVIGKGGVGKTTIASLWANKTQARLVIWDELNLTELTSEYLDQKFGQSFFGRFFSRRLQKEGSPFRALTQAAPGFRDLSRLGKIWFDGKSTPAVIDMPATGHAITAFQALYNYSKLLGRTPFGQDAGLMLADFNQAHTEFLLVCSPEPSAFEEIQELENWLKSKYPGATIGVVLNGQLPEPIESPRNDLEQKISARSRNEKKVAAQLAEYCAQRNLKLTRHPWTAPQ